MTTTLDKPEEKRNIEVSRDEYTLILRLRQIKNKFQRGQHLGKAIVEFRPDRGWLCLPVNGK